jgi:DNA adenine methylase
MAFDESVVPRDSAIGDKKIVCAPARPRAFLRWAGGKQFYLKDLIAHLVAPNAQVFHEPFLGGASVALSLQFVQAYLSDINAELINCYQHVRIAPERMASQLQLLGREIDADLYYKIRSEFNGSRGSESFDQAFRFIVLNRTSFNGIYRVNKRGEYNVPFGKPKPCFPTKEALKAASVSLQSCELLARSFDEKKTLPKKGELLYLDPPYPQISETAYFRHYSIDRFSDDMQARVAKFAAKARKRGVFVVISNADTPLIRQLYTGWNFFPLEKTRFVSCKRERLKVSELIIRSY